MIFGEPIRISIIWLSYMSHCAPWYWSTMHDIESSCLWKVGEMYASYHSNLQCPGDGMSYLMLSLTILTSFCPLWEDLHGIRIVYSCYRWSFVSNLLVLVIHRIWEVSQVCSQDNTSKCFDFSLENLVLISSHMTVEHILKLHWLHPPISHSVEKNVQ